MPPQKKHNEKILRLWRIWQGLREQFKRGELEGRIEETMKRYYAEEKVCRRTFFTRKKELGLK